MFLRKLLLDWVYEWGQIQAAATVYGATPFGLNWIQMNLPLGIVIITTAIKMLREMFKPWRVIPILCGTISPESGWAGSRKGNQTSVDDLNAS